MRVETAFKELPFHLNIRVAKGNGKVCLIEENREYYHRDVPPSYMIITYSKEGGHQYKGFHTKFMANRFFNKIVKRHGLKDLSEFDSESFGNTVVYELGKEM